MPLINSKSLSIPHIIMADLSYFDRLPGEIRIMIYALLLQDNGNQVIEIRNERPEQYKRKSQILRSTYNIVEHTLHRQSRLTTYTTTSNIDMHTSIMQVNRKVYEESAHMLYGTHVFSFGRDIEAIVPFFSDLTVQTRPLVTDMALTKQGAVFSRDYDHCEWDEMCNFLRRNMAIKTLNLTIEGGKPIGGWEGYSVLSADDFGSYLKVRYEPLEWVWQLLTVKGIRRLEIQKTVMQIPRAHSNAMNFYAAFSASVEEGFSEFLRGELLAAV